MARTGSSSSQANKDDARASQSLHIYSPFPMGTAPVNQLLLPAVVSLLFLLGQEVLFARFVDATCASLLLQQRLARVTRGSHVMLTRSQCALHQRTSC